MSVIEHEYSYGAPFDLVEIKRTVNGRELIVGYLTAEKAIEIIKQELSL